MRIATLLLLVAASIPLTAQEGQTVIFAGGTVPSLKSETSGHFEISDPAALAFVYPSGKLSIPFQRVNSNEYSEQVVHHLGVLPLIAVSLVRARKKFHLLSITYQDPNDTSQIAVFRISKRMPSTLLPVLQARIPQVTHPCGPGSYQQCLQR